MRRHHNGTRHHERIYLGSYEIYRAYPGTSAMEDPSLERETLHVMDDHYRIALVETRTIDTSGHDPAPRQLTRYQHNNHLGSTAIELDEEAQIISYEEYAPYGNSTFQATATETPKRYRYTGKERDEETGLYYYGARYYVPWLGRWLSVDPAGLVDGPNLYAYTRDNPLRYTDRRGTQCDPSVATCPQLMDNWSYARPVHESGVKGHNVQREHPTQVNLRSEQRGGRYTRAVSKERGEQTILVETGRGYFHTEVGKLQAEINARVRAGVIKTESELIEATREAYRIAAERTGVTVNQQALDRAIVSNLATLSETAAQTQSELSQATGPTTVTEQSIQASFTDPNPPPALTATPVQTTAASTSAKANAVASETTQTAVAADAPAAAVPPAAAPTPPPAAPAPTVAGAAAPGRLARAAAWTAEVAPKALRVAGVVLTVVGAAKEADETVNFERRHGRGELNAQLMGATTMLVGVVAGVVDDAFAAAQVPMLGAPAITVQSYENRGSGPVQAAAGDAIRGFLGWGFSLGF